MRLCFLADSVKNSHCQNWIKYFAERGHKTYWISLPPHCFINIKNNKYYPLKGFGRKPLDILFNLFTVKNLIKKIKPDILHAHYAGVNGLLGALSGFHPLIVSAWGSDIFVAVKRKIVRPFIKYTLERADLITCNGKPLLEEIIKLGIDSKKIKFIYWGTDMQKFKPTIKIQKIREELKVFDFPMIISLRSLEPICNVETLIKAIPFVLKQIPDAKFIIAGDGSEKEKLKKIAENLNISNSIRFIGWIDYDKVPQYLNSADICVSTSLSDGDLSQTIQQAMACEISIVTTDLTVNKERIKDGENGFIFPQRDYKSLAEKIIKLLKNKELRIKIGKNGKKTIEAELDYYKNMEKAENLYKELIKRYEKH